MVDEAYFNSKFRKGPGCWLWLGYIDRDGYGRYAKGKAAYRVAYELSIGPIPEGYEVDHLCFNRACVNPDHLEAVTRRENTMRSPTASTLNAAKTHCLRGHPFDAENTYNRCDGRRVCRACLSARAREAS